MPAEELFTGELSTGELYTGELYTGELYTGELSDGELSDGELPAGELSSGDYFLFIEEYDVANYADDNSAYACKEDTNTVIKQLVKYSRILLEWVANNVLKANPDKFHLLSVVV